MKSDPSTHPLISIVVPAYNAQQYIAETVESVIAQTYQNWELIVVDNGSQDTTASIVQSFGDTRIKYLFESTRGVGHARNRGLKEINGDYLCFLDADDTWPTNSLGSRLKVFQENQGVDFVDGAAQYMDENSNLLDKIHRPSFHGKPFSRLLELDPSCLFNASWMIKVDPNEDYNFETDMTHSEDLFFLLSISRDKVYDYTPEIILYYRQHESSAMNNLSGLENGYIQVIKKSRVKFNVTAFQLLYLKLKSAKIMLLSHTFDGKAPCQGFLSIFRILFA